MRCVSGYVYEKAYVAFSTTLCICFFSRSKCAIFIYDMDLADTLRKKMDSAQLTIRLLSDISDLPEDMIKAILYHRVKDVKLSTVVKLADAFGCSIDELIARQKP